MLMMLQVMFLFTDAHVVEEGFLELVNNMLSTGMVPALFTDAERDALVDCVRDEVQPSYPHLPLLSILILLAILRLMPSNENGM